MGEWSEYFEDYPEENPANFPKRPDLGPKSQFFPHLHLSQLTKDELAIENAKIEELNARAQSLANSIVQAKTKEAYRIDECPICRTEEMSIFKVEDTTFYCECRNCKVSGHGSDIEDIYQTIQDNIWDA